VETLVPPNIGIKIYFSDHTKYAQIFKEKT